MLYLIKLVIPHNVSSIDYEPFASRMLRVHPSNKESAEGFIVEHDPIDNIISSCYIPILIKKYFFPSTIVKADISQKWVKLEERRKKFRKQVPESAVGMEHSSVTGHLVCIQKTEGSANVSIVVSISFSFLI